MEAASQNEASNSLQIRSIHSILGESFLVPSYQRGYRWTETEVRALLNDLLEFARLKLSGDAFYCLQPLVIRRNGEQCEVVDGQQRLTTIHLILRMLRELSGGTTYSLEYASRPDSRQAIAQPEAIDADKCIDYYHIRMAWNAIESWFKEHQARGDYTARTAIFTTLLAKDGNDPNVRVIWYELSGSEHPIEMFTRLNRGKIPLTSAELIRALLLNEKNFGGLRNGRDREKGELPPPPAQFRPYEIAREWDAIEQDLQQDRYWHFLQGDSDAPAARIELLFDLYVRLNAHADAVQPQADERHRVFFAYQSLIGVGKVAAGERWWEVKKIALRLREWYDDPRMYHLVGCLVWLKSSGAEGRNTDKRAAAMNVLVEALRDAAQLPRAEIRRRLRRRIRETLFGPQDGVDWLAAALQDMTYGTKHADNRIRAVLLAFNVASHMQVADASDHFFPFHSFKHQSWDIEHIRATEDKMPDRDYLQSDWLKQLVAYLESDQDLDPEAIRQDLEQARDLAAASRARLEAEFPIFYRHLLARYEGSIMSGDGGGNSIGNLALLPADINRAIGNQMFRLKRREILQREKKGQFVPLCTRNVFLKYYTSEVKSTLYWSATDRQAYVLAMVDALSAFFSEEPA